MNPGNPVLLFDGECGLCQRVIRIMMALDRRGRLRYAPLQGPAAQAFLRARGLPVADFDSLVFVPDWDRRDSVDYALRSDGVIRALQAIGGVGRLLAWGRVVPAGWRDAAYRQVARWRYRMFGPWRGGRPLRAKHAARLLA